VVRRFADDQDAPLDKKPIWLVYQALGTEREVEATVFARPIIGIKCGSAIRNRGEVR
jgi:hypothetical protein